MGLLAGVEVMVGVMSVMGVIIYILYMQVCDGMDGSGVGEEIVSGERGRRGGGKRVGRSSF